MQNTYTPFNGKRIRTLRQNPFFGFLLIGALLLALQLTAILTGGAWPKSSMLNGFATVMIYAIVGYGFTYLLGYAGLA